MLTGAGVGDVQDDAVAPLHPGIALAASAPHLDTPLAATLRFDALHARPRWSDLRRLRRAAASGRYGPRWRIVVEREAWPPATAARWVLIVVVAIFAPAIIASAVDGDLPGAAIGSTITLMIGTILGAIVFAFAAALRRRRWRPHAVVARFAEDNALPYRLLAPRDTIPRLVLEAGRRHVGRPQCTDVVEARVRDRELAVGRQRCDLYGGHRRRTIVLVWAAVRLADAAQVRTAADVLRLHERRPGATADAAEVEVLTDGPWLALGVETGDGDPSVLETLLTGIDEALGAVDHDEERDRD